MKDSIAWAGSFVYRYAVFSSLSLVLGRAGVVLQKLEARGGGAIKFIVKAIDVADSSDSVVYPEGM